MSPVLRLYEDVLCSGAAVSLPALPRMIFVVQCAIALGDRALRADEAWSGETAVSFEAEGDGASLWRWELVPDNAADGAAPALVASREKLTARLDTLPKGALLLRGDSVTFPAGGCAHRHRHRGPGIRCLIEGAIRIDTHGRSSSYGPGGAWYESGPEPVFAQAADRPTRFIRVMILPATYIGKSSIEYVNEEDKAKPRTQQYRIYADMPIAFSAAP